MSSLHCLNVVLLMECSVALLRMYLHSVKFIIHLSWQVDLSVLPFFLKKSKAILLHSLDFCSEISVQKFRNLQFSCIF